MAINTRIYASVIIGTSDS